MRTKLIESNKPEKYIHSVRNVDQGSITSITTIFNSIPMGTPLVLNLGPTLEPSFYQNGLQPGAEDGLQVVLPSSAASGGQGLGTLAVQMLHYGIAAGNMAYGQYGECFIHGVFPYALVTRQTRSATTVSWPSIASLAAGQLLTVDSINNAYATEATSAATHQFSIVQIFLIDSLASLAGSATASTDTRLANLTKQRVFIRGM